MQTTRNNMMKTKLILTYLLTLICATSIQAQDRVVQNTKTGRLEWADSGEEAFFFGVNYIVSFDKPYKQSLEKGYDIFQVIDQDVNNLAKLGFNAFRLHVWDSEISDIEGNLQKNQHLQLLDYLIYQLQEHGIYTLLTPIYYGGGSGAKEPYRGFSMNYPKVEMHTNPEAVAAHKNYLEQFVQHVNPYTGHSYGEDPMIVAFEICNEPAEKSAESARDFAVNMRKAIRKVGCSKPILYNSTTVREKAYTILDSDMDGATFQWYPSGLRTRSCAQRGTFLPHVDHYMIPFYDEKFFEKKSRYIYEFDAADVTENYMYPAMAISFKEVGMQWATMFSYEPSSVAESNTSYFTHYMNLAYTPQKAISLSIANELFRNNQFKRNREAETKQFEMDDFVLDYDNNFASVINSGKFIYTSDNTINIRSEEIEEVIGYGNSNVVEYNGYGAYFLNKISKGVWRLEVMPDAIAIKDPHSNPQIDDPKTIIRYSRNRMKLKIDDVGSSFYIKGINDNNFQYAESNNGSFDIEPGVYLIYKDEVGDTQVDRSFCAPAPSAPQDRLYLVHAPEVKHFAGDDLTIEVLATSPKSIKSIKVVNQPVYYPASTPSTLLSQRMEKIDNYKYRAVISGDILSAGRMNYAFLVEYEDGASTVMPADHDDRIGGLEYFKIDTYESQIVERNAPIELLSASVVDNCNIYLQELDYGLKAVSSDDAMGSKLIFAPQKRKGKASPHASGCLVIMQNYIGDIIESLKPGLGSYDAIEVVCSAPNDSEASVKVALIDTEGVAFGTTIELGGSDKQTIKLSDLTQQPMALLPRPFPNYMTFWYESPRTKELDINKIERVEFIIPQSGSKPHIELSAIRLK